MLSELVRQLVNSKNEAADEVLLEALRLGSDLEKSLALGALMRRESLKGLSGVIQSYNLLSPALQSSVLQNVKLFHAALRDCARSHQTDAAITAIRLVAMGRQGKLTYLLSEGLHSGDDDISRTAVEAMVSLARWVATETRRLQRGRIPPAPVQLPRSGGPIDPAARDSPVDAADAGPDAVYRHIISQRIEIEQAVARAMDVHRGKHGHELLRAALLLADSPQSRTLAILQTAKHGGQSAMIRRLQQPPDSEHIEAFLLGATHGGIRGHFGIVFSHIVEPPVLDALLHKTHWLKDQQLLLCMRQVTRGPWWIEEDLEKELNRRDNEDAARIGEWIAASGVHDVVQDERLESLRRHLGAYFPGRLRLLRIAMRRPPNASVSLLKSLLHDPDERIVRLAAREIVRRRPAEFENTLIQLMSTAPESVRRVIGRSVGQVGFEHFWQRFDRMDRAARKAAGKAMFKVLPDSVARLERRLRSGPIEQRIKAIAIAQELGAADALAPVIMQLCQDAHPKLRSKAVGLLGELKSVPPEVVLEKALADSDSRVRANAIEVLEHHRTEQYVPLLTNRARAASNRERANAIKALHRMRVGTASTQLLNMLKDERPEHRISALWALRQIGWWQMIHEVGHLAKDDPNLRVRRYAMAVLRGVADMIAHRPAKEAG